MQHLLSFGVNKVGGQDAGLLDVRLCITWRASGDPANELPILSIFIAVSFALSN